MEKLHHKQVDVGELKLHVVEIGTVVLLSNGFSKIWYSWRHQMIALADAGFHAIAPDFKGYGLSNQPSQIEKDNSIDLVEDMTDLLDAFGIKKVFVVAKDFGALIACYLYLLYPERILHETLEGARKSLGRLWAF
ncbi:hypothetical protein SUGI_0263430 [Cryptomeria japonica]|nr:hypothetical protein SUGI_0263430 [Cryptomeria japonica]